MRLTAILNFTKNLYPGNRLRGKKRYVKPVTLKAMNLLRKELEREERVMALLRHPYLSQEESSGHAVELHKHEKFMAKVTEYARLEKCKPHIHVEDRLKHLTVKDAWD